MTPRISASSAWPSPVTPPPITIRPGLKNDTRLASTWPIRRPLSRISCTACGVALGDRETDVGGGELGPCSSSSAASAGDRPERAAAVASRASAAPPANASRQPVLPQAQVGPELVDPDVADVAGAAVDAAVELAVDDDPAADAGADLDEQEVAARSGRRRRAARRPPAR